MHNVKLLSLPNLDETVNTLRNKAHFYTVSSSRNRTHKGYLCPSQNKVSA